MAKFDYVHGEYFCGNKISDYGIQNGYVDYATLAKSFDAVLNNDIMAITSDIGYWEIEQGDTDNSDEIEEIEEEIDMLESEAAEIEDDDKLDEINSRIDELRDRIDDLENEQGDIGEVYQWYIVSDQGADILRTWTDEVLYYNETLDMYLWGVTHYGTSWSYVLTDIRCNVPYEEEV